MKWIWLFAGLLLIGCSQQPKVEKPALPQGEEETLVKEFEKGNRLLDGQQFSEAAQIYDQLILKHPVHQLTGIMLYNSGIAHLQNMNCEMAGDRFRRVVRQMGKSFPQLKARAQLRMGDVYTCIGEDHKTITNLIELAGQKHGLPFEVAKAELPAKLAGAYARIGNNKEAEKYFRLAERGLAQVQQSSKSLKDQKSTLAKTLFLMGGISQLNIQTMPSEDYFATIQALQKYLFKAVEINDPVWSAQAIAQLEQAYHNTWSYIDRAGSVEDADPGLAKRQATIAQLHVAQTALRSLDRLFSQRIPDPTESSVVAAVVKKMKVHETKLRNFVATNIIGTDLTAEALAAEGLKRVGQVLNPDPILEAQALKRMKSKKK